MILSEVLQDTAKEYQRIEKEEEVNREAITMQDNPTLENIYQRLEQMEVKLYREYIILYNNTR
jgi:uncharacterized protein YrzB (UPF0473 family)